MERCFTLATCLEFSATCVLQRLEFHRGFLFTLKACSNIVLPPRLTGASFEFLIIMTNLCLRMHSATLVSKSFVKLGAFVQKTSM